MLEVGCGTGQLTGSLLARGLRVTAVEPGGRMLARARQRLADVGWRRVADALVDAGTLSLLSYSGLEDPRIAAGQQALRAASARNAPELAAAWPAYRDLEATLAGVAARRCNDVVLGAALTPTARCPCRGQRSLHRRLGRPIRSSTVACLVTARRAS